ncbi:exodeoxyribonuclease V subunit alpha [Paraflavitalea soli]|uniref:RecBCD enzyme subunit RecD n=1 Tax=Paraflavitalea soli TaxID=2315862 RepID=A0A3B7MX51_9BACT|nr:exodeoxyribonuclease V subunit alpha [Paraflavitalea soli]AXY77596.1 exodeoxyribonuclease V subunit alpha [Paraflavitalea soli]
MHALNDVHQQFAEYFGIPALKPYAYLLSKKLSEGHICLHLDQLTASADDLPAYYHLLPGGSQSLETLPLVGKNGDDRQPFVLYQNRLYLQRYFRYETGFLQRIRQFLAEEQAQLPQRLALLRQHKAFISRLFSNPGNGSAGASEDLADWPLAAAITGILHNFTIITGGPGTGKTTTVAKILSLLYTTNPALKVALAAPTGKAAARMAESLRQTTLPLEAPILEKFQALHPSTIHRLLKPVAGTHYFRHNQQNPLSYDVVIVDECSMIDVALFAKLLDAIAPGTRLIMLGDKDQLASVEAGSLFGDLCLAQPILNQFSAERLALINEFIEDDRYRLPESHISHQHEHPLFQHLVELRRSHRFTGHTGIGSFSKAVIGNDAAALQQFLPPSRDEQVVIDPLYSNDLFEKFIAGYAAFITEKDISSALKKMNALRVLCAVREGEQGLYAINSRIEKWLDSKKLIQHTVPFYENRPIILTRNYYEHGLFNGDTGIIRANKQGVLMAWFEDSTGTLRSIMPGYLSEAETVFAMTIHKSQGSEFDEVLVILPPIANSPLLTRELLYTAVTRARKRVYLQGSGETILEAAQRVVERASGIAARFQPGSSTLIS